jgi:hypothetical protein
MIERFFKSLWGGGREAKYFGMILSSVSLIAEWKQVDYGNCLISDWGGNYDP